MGDSEPSGTPGEVTALLRAVSRGERTAGDRLIPIVYEELRAIASARMSGERPDHTLDPTSLVHEAYLRLIDTSLVEWEDRSHFFRVAAGAMRRVLVDHARARAALKRGGDRRRIALEDPSDTRQPVDLIALDDALARLEQIDPRQRAVVELRFFGGLDVEETARALGVSPRTVEEDWRLARAWLRRSLAQADAT